MADRTDDALLLGLALHVLPMVYLAGEVFGHGIMTGVAAGLYSLVVMLLCRRVARV